MSPAQSTAAAMVAKARGLELTGRNGLLKLFTKNALETALNEEVTEHLGHEKNRADPAASRRICVVAAAARRCFRTPPARSVSTCREIETERSSRRSCSKSAR